MKCAFCRNGETQPGYVVVTLEHEGSVVVFKDVPADVCDTCGEYYLSSEVTSDLLRRAEVAASGGTEVHVERFAA